MKTIFGYTAAVIFSVMLSGMVKPAFAYSTDLKACLLEAKKKEISGDDLKPFVTQCLKNKKGETGVSDEKKAALKARITTCLERADKERLQGKTRNLFLRTCLVEK